MEQVSAARGMHGWLRQPREPGNQNAQPAPSSLAARDPISQFGLGGGRKRATDHRPADDNQRQQKRHKASSPSVSALTQRTTRLQTA